MRTLLLLTCTLTLCACASGNSAGGGTVPISQVGDSAASSSSGGQQDATSSDVVEDAGGSSSGAADTVSSSSGGADTAVVGVPDTSVTPEDSGSSTSADTAVPPTPDTATPAPDATTPAEDTNGGSAASGACTNAADKKIVEGATFQQTVTDCALGAIGQAAKAQKCLSDKTGVSSGCASCFGGLLDCTFKNCLLQCAANQSAPGCVSCLNSKCYPAFTTCSGLDP